MRAFLAACAIAHAGMGVSIVVADDAFREDVLRSVSDERTRPVDRALILAVAKVCANEASLLSSVPADCALIWQTVRNRGRTSRARLRWLRAHSNCVLGDTPPEAREGDTRPPAGSNCWWTWHLTDSDRAPANFELYQAISWGPRYAKRWQAMRTMVRALVLGYEPEDGWPCPEDPDTWGGPMDHARALENGLIPLGCNVGRSGPVNEGYLYAGH